MLQLFLRYIKLLVENCHFFIPHLCLVAPQGVTPLEFREDLDIHKTRMNGLSCGEVSIADARKNPSRFSRVMITNVLRPFLLFTVYSVLVY